MENSSKTTEMETRSIRLGLSGLHCSGCAMRVKEALGQLAGVRSVTFADDRESCTVELDGIHAPYEEYVRAVEEAGFNAQLL